MKYIKCIQRAVIYYYIEPVICHKKCWHVKVICFL